MSGYEIPWEFLDVIENLAAMRAWQERYNSVGQPLSSSDTPGDIRQTDSRRERDAVHSPTPRMTFTAARTSNVP